MNIIVYKRKPSGDLSELMRYTTNYTAPKVGDRYPFYAGLSFTVEEVCQENENTIICVCKENYNLY